MKRIAVLGTGAMGSRIVENLLKAQYEVVVYNRTAEKVAHLVQQGATYAATPRAAATQADVVISMVTDNEGSRWLWLAPETGAVLGLGAGQIAIESSTLTVDWTKELAQVVEQQGAAFLDAPVVGSRPQAEAGKLIYLVGGNSATLAAVESIFSTTSAAVHHVGAIGQGMAMKLAVNALFGIQVAALAEAIELLHRTGISREQAIACLGELPVTSLAAKAAGGLIVQHRHVPLFPIDLVEKDFRYVLETAQAFGATMPTATAIHQVYQAAIEQGYGGENITGVVQLFL